MYDASDLLKMMKKSSMEAVRASKPSDFYFGKVLSEKPLRININQKLILTESMLVLTRNVTDYKLMMTVNHKTEKSEGGTGEGSFALHDHEYKGKKEFLVHNALKTGEEVLLIRQNGGQKYVVIDRLEEKE